VFDRAYESVPSWETGRPQGVVVRLAEAGLIAGSVLDVGCGTGHNSLLLAERGHAVLGIDFAAAAVARASAASAERNVAARFVTMDALQLADLGRTFDTIIDIGLFHTLQPFDRVAYAASLRTAIAPDGACFVVAWSERNDFGYGPQRITRGMIRAAFSRGWRVESIDAELLDTRLAGGVAHAWLARLRPRRVRAGRGESRSGRPRIGQLLVAGVDDERPLRVGRRQIEQLPDDPLANRAERLLGEIVEGPVQLAGQFLGAGPRDSHVAGDERADRLEPETQHKRGRHRLDPHRARPAEHQGQARHVAAAGVSNGHLAALGRGQKDTNQPADDDEDVGPVPFAVEQGARGDVDPDRLGHQPLAGRVGQ
jgi:SAM-dependent methyltransferase